MITEIIFSREWAIPNKHTFLIKPIGSLIAKYMGKYPGVWVDPFAGFNSPAQITNDLNPNAPTTYHLTALEFAQNLTEPYVGLLFDPPYSLRQLCEVYKSVGIKPGMKDTQDAFMYSEVRKALLKRHRPEIVIKCGWNTNSFGKKHGYEIIEILLVSHGGQHNDTIVTVEQEVT